MTKKEITKKLLKDETCAHCKYFWAENILGNGPFCTKRNNDKKLPKEYTCEDFEKRPVGKKLKVTWSQQSLQDLKAWHGLDAEEELTKAASEEMKSAIEHGDFGK
jgi:hypothetical protein